MEKNPLFDKLEAILAYCSVPYDDQLPYIQVFVGFTVCHFLCKNNIGNIGKGKQECFGTTEEGQDSVTAVDRSTGRRFGRLSTSS